MNIDRGVYYHSVASRLDYRHGLFLCVDIKFIVNHVTLTLCEDCICQYCTCVCVFSVSHVMFFFWCAALIRDVLF